MWVQWNWVQWSVTHVTHMTCLNAVCTTVKVFIQYVSGQVLTVDSYNTQGGYMCDMQL